MKKFVFAFLTIGLIYSSAANAQGYLAPANERAGSPTLLIGIAVDIGEPLNKSDFGLTAKIMSSNHPHRFVVAGGISYFPWATKDPIGLDLSAGYNFDNFAPLAGYDVLRWKPQISVGYVPTKISKYCDPGGTLDGNDCLYLPSDQRLKSDITLVAVRDDGMKFYSFKYIWSDETYVGVMAQDLLQDPRWAGAVRQRDNGFYAVNYKSLGIRMTTLARWHELGPSSVLVASGHDIRVLKKAA